MKVSKELKRAGISAFGGFLSVIVTVPTLSFGALLFGEMIPQAYTAGGLAGAVKATAMDGVLLSLCTALSAAAIASPFIELKMMKEKLQPAAYIAGLALGAAFMANGMDLGRENQTQAMTQKPDSTKTSLAQSAKSAYMSKEVTSAMMPVFNAQTASVTADTAPKMGPKTEPRAVLPEAQKIQPQQLSLS